MTKFYGGKRSNQLNNRATDIEKERIGRQMQKYNLTQTDVIHFAVMVWDSMSEDERQKWIKDLLA